MNMNLASVLTCSLMVVVVSGVSLQSDFDITWGDGRGKFLNDGELITLSLDKFSGSGYQSKSEYLFGKIEMDIKLVPGNSAGTVTTFYLSSQGSNHDEIDFEFLGNLSGDPYTVHTNVFSQGKGDKEQQFHLWFDPTMDFHTYSILWSPKRIIFSIDGIPIRDFRNCEEKGVPFPTNQAMRVYSSLWNADDWATRGGLVKTDWTKAPFTASFKNFEAKDACKWSESSSGFHCTNPAWLNQNLDAPNLGILQEMKKKYMIYDYCSDLKRFPMGLSPECTDNTVAFEM